MIVQRRQPVVTDAYDDGDVSPRYRVQLQLQPAQPNIYEVWDVETPPPRSKPFNEPSRRRVPTPRRVRTPRLVEIESLSDDDFEEEQIVYARHPRRARLPGNVRIVHVRQDASTIRY